MNHATGSPPSLTSPRLNLPSLFHSLVAFRLYLNCEKFKAISGNRGKILAEIRDKFLGTDAAFRSESMAIFDKVGGAVVEMILESADRWTLKGGSTTLDPNMLDGVARECRSMLKRKYM